MGIIFTSLLAIIFAEALWQALLTFLNWIANEREKDMSDKYVTLDEFMNERGEWVKQVVYKVDGDFNGNIKGDNVTVILMGNGDINGDINTKNGEIFINKGNVNGDIKADKVLMPNKKKDVYFGRNGIVVRCPHCNELYTQSLSINGNTSEDGAKLTLDVKIDVEEKCESCKYHAYHDKKSYWCTHGGMSHLCIGDGTVCKYYEGRK